ncbi:MAG: DUF58 domain-containing protein [bacterium]|nr:DUF58 domain-containing protein [bacterium]
MDAALRDLLSRVRELELVARKNVSSLLTGNYLTTIRGRGLEFHEARRYVQGEPVRRIDWKMTARMGYPHVRTFLEERQREIFIALDISPSMATGWQERTKLEVAVETAATLALSATEAGDRLGFLTFSDRVFELDRPRAGKKQLFRTLQNLVRVLEKPPEACPVSDPRCALHAIQRFRGRRFVVFLISDFIDHDVPEDLKYIRRRHDVSLIHLYDPLEYRPSLLRLPAYSPEGDAGLTAFSPGEAGSLEEMTAFLQRECERHGIVFGSFSTAMPVSGALIELFQKKRWRLGR